MLNIFIDIIICSIDLISLILVFHIYISFYYYIFYYGSYYVYILYIFIFIHLIHHYLDVYIHIYILLNVYIYMFMIIYLMVDQIPSSGNGHSSRKKYFANLSRTPCYSSFSEPILSNDSSCEGSFITCQIAQDYHR